MPDSGGHERHNSEAGPRRNVCKLQLASYWALGSDGGASGMIAPAGTLPVDQLDMLAEERVRAIGDLNLTIRGPAGLAPVAGSTTEAEAGALVVLTWTTARPYRANGAGH